MIFSKVMGPAGALVGFGFGIFAATKNFNPDLHQSDEMAERTQYFSEILLQVGMIELYAIAMGALSGTAGALLDLATYLCCGCKDNDMNITEQIEMTRVRFGGQQ